MKKITINNILEILCAIILFGVIVLILCSYQQIPGIIPSHYDLYGKADDFGNKDGIWSIIVLEVLTYIGMSVMQRYPQKLNYPVQVTETNKQSLFSLGTRVMLLIKLFVVIVYSYAILCSIGILSLNLFFMIPGLITTVIVIPFIFIAKMKKYKE